MDPRKTSMIDRFPASAGDLNTSHNPMISIEVGRYLVQYHFHRRGDDMVHFSRRALRRTETGPRALTEEQSRRFGNAMVADDVLHEPGPLCDSATFIYQWCRDDWVDAVGQLLELERRDVPVEYDCGEARPRPTPPPDAETRFDPDEHLVEGDLVVLTDSEFWDLSQLDDLRRPSAIHIDGTRVTDLLPLVRHPSVWILDVARTRISDLSPVAHLKKLYSLDISRTLVSDIEPLAELPELRKLVAAHSGLVDLEPLASSELAELDVSHTTIRRLPALPRLQELIASHTAVRDLAPLAESARLRQLDLSHTKVHDLSALAGKPNLATLNLAHTRVRDVRPLEGLFCLESLDLSYCPVKNIEALATLRRLRRLDLGHTRVRDFTPLLKLSRLETLSLWGCTIRRPVLARLAARFDRGALMGPWRPRWRKRFLGTPRRSR